MIKKIVGILLVTWSLLSGGTALAIEEPQYDVLKVVGDVEFRRYEPYIIAKVTVDGGSPDRQAFGILAGYIFGDNETEEKMAMTAPVETQGNDYAFVMERKYSMETLPAPRDKRVQLQTKPARVVAVRRFSGRWSSRIFARHQEELLAELDRLGVEVTGASELARYDSPFTPWFMRRNEVIVPVAWSTVEEPTTVAREAPARL
jgi:hypothetical protein